MKGKFVLGILAVTGILALSSTAAQAGSGGPSALTSFFVCHQINGANLRKNVDVVSDDVGAGGTRTNVTIGQAIMACAQAFLFNPGVTPDDPITPTNNIKPTGNTPGLPLPTAATELMCYTASVSKKTGNAGLFDAVDALFFGEFGLPKQEDIPGSRDPQLICAPASITGP